MFPFRIGRIRPQAAAIVEVDLTNAGVDAETFGALVQWMYSGDQSIVAPDNAMALLAAAHRFGVTDLFQVHA